MPRRIAALLVVGAAALAAVAASTAPAVAAPTIALAPNALEAPGGPVRVKSDWLRQSPGWSGCTAAGGNLHCYVPSDIREAYGVDQLPERGEGQTIVLVDSYGSPRAADELQAFHDAFFPSLPQPSFDQVFPLGNPQLESGNPNANGQSGPGAASGWAGEAALDVQWAYAIAPLAHIVLLAVPPAETLGVQGFPNLFKAIDGAIDTYPAGTVFSMSLAAAEQSFGGAAQQQASRFDQVFQKGIAKGDSFFGASGDNGTTGLSKQQKDSRPYAFPTAQWPSSSPYVTSVGGTQLQFGWTWNPQSDVPFAADGSFNPAYFSSANAPGSSAATNVVWNESWLPAATGGGPSTIYARPSWQSSVASVIGGDHRGLPDVSWNAAVNGAVLVNLQSFLAPADQGFYLIGGTSAATPQVAALTALANERRESMGKAPLGNVSERLYAIGSAAFTDVAPVHQGAAGVISGNLDSNTMFSYNGDGNAVAVGSVPGWPALEGWDMTTGFGTPWAPTYVAELAAT
ncbi:MAG TPA: S53 family peptidase [Gaiella sp.]|nr:S53 family peptidase [Gaiella sp.]